MNSRRTVERTDRADAVADAGVGAALGYSRPGSYEELRAVLSSGNRAAARRSFARSRSIFGSIRPPSRWAP